MKLSLDGLGLGDALGEMLSYQAHTAPRRLAENNLPAGPWFHTDDTEMAISISAVLKSHGSVHQDALAKRFARRFERDPERGYGKMTRIQMREIMAGAKWRDMAANAFGGQGSMGNGSAMRVAPLGAYFADDLERCAEEAKASSLVTHTHPEGVAGAIAVAVAAAMAWQLREDTDAERAEAFFDAVLRQTPESKVRRGILLASTTPPEIPVADVARSLGNGSLVTAPDTVPFCTWMAAHHLDRFVDALGIDRQCRRRLRHKRSHRVRNRCLECRPGEHSGRVVEGERTNFHLMKPILLTAAGNPENQDRGLVIHDGSESRALRCRWCWGAQAVGCRRPSWRWSWFARMPRQLEHCRFLRGTPARDGRSDCQRLRCRRNNLRLRDCNPGGNLRRERR